MKKNAAETVENVKGALNTKIKVLLEELRKLLDTTPNKNLIPMADDKINKIIYELQSLVARMPSAVQTIQPVPAKADDSETKKAPAFFRKNLDYGDISTSKKFDIIGRELIEKEATIRGEAVRECPFGLPIPEACANVGEAINRMAPSEENKQIIKANRIVYAYHKTCKQCPYTDKILSEHKKVDCNFGDTAAGQKSVSFRGSPIYPSTFYGVGLDGLYGYPLGYYADNAESRNLFFGLFSLLGFNTTKELIKLADEYDKSGQEEKTEILDNLLKKLQAIKEEYKDTFEKIEKYLVRYRENYAVEKDEPGLLYESSDAWFGPRKINK